jgi:DNA-binding LytR/AlgR family response regulator
MCGLVLAEEIASSRQMLAEHQFRAVFLDLEMPGGHGIGFLPELISMRIPVVLCTGFDNFAAEAFDHGVVDYLLKPFGSERLSRCLARLSQEKSDSSSDVVLFGDQVRCWPVNLKEVVLVEASGSYVTIHTLSGKKFTLSKALKDVFALLNDRDFVQANRSQIVRLEFLESIKKEKGSLLSGYLKDGQAIKFSRRQAQALRERFFL